MRHHVWKLCWTAVKSVKLPSETFMERRLKNLDLSNKLDFALQLWWCGIEVYISKADSKYARVNVLIFLVNTSKIKEGGRKKFRPYLYSYHVLCQVIGGNLLLLFNSIFTCPDLFCLWPFIFCCIKCFLIMGDIGSFFSIILYLHQIHVH